MFGYLILISIDLIVYSLVLVSVEKIYRRLEMVFHHTSKLFEVRQNYSMYVVFSS